MLKRADFPKGFQFGSATSAYQIEGHAFGGAGATHWDRFARSGGVVNNQNGDIACDHYHRFHQDLDLLQEFDAYRFSTSWARVLPAGKGEVNQAGLDFYDKLVDAMLERNLAPFLTLYHWELPDRLALLGGWTNPDIANWFGDYVDIIMDRLGDRIASVATINEPWCVTYLAHYLGQHAPGLRDSSATAKAIHNVLLAHGNATARLRERGQKNLGIVLNFEALVSHSQTASDLDATRRYDAIINRMFIEPLMTGNYPSEILHEFGQHLPSGWQSDMDLIRQPIDWLGVNYYTRQTIAADPEGSWPHCKSMATTGPKTQMGWDIYPEGLYETLVRLKQDYTKTLPIYVTENGMARADSLVNNTINDIERLNYLSDHLYQVHRAIDEGVDVRGYFYWSLLDNFEWALGYEKRFGLIHVDFETQKRTPKNSYLALIDAIK